MRSQRNASAMSPMASRRLKSIGSSSSFPASILEKSRMSLMTVSSEWRRLDGLQIFALFGGELGLERELGHADDAVEWRADLVTHVGEELALSLIPVPWPGGRSGGQIQR